MTGQPRDPTDGPDAGVVRRVRRRTAGAAVGAGVLAVALAALGWGWPGWFAGAAGAVIGGCAVLACAAGAAMLARRAVLWSRAGLLVARVGRGEPPDPGAGSASGSGGISDSSGSSGSVASCGPAVPLRRSLPGAFRVRRNGLPASVLPLRARSGPLAEGRAVIVHPRTDQLLPRPGDSIEVHALGPRGPFLIVRAGDGAVFAADGWTLSLL